MPESQKKYVTCTKKKSTYNKLPQKLKCEISQFLNSHSNLFIEPSQMKQTQISSNSVDRCVMNMCPWSCVCISVSVHVCLYFLGSVLHETWVEIQTMSLWWTNTRVCICACNTILLAYSEKTHTHMPTHTLMWWQGTVMGRCRNETIAKNMWGTTLTKGKHSHIWVLNSISLVDCVRQRPHWGMWDQPCLQLYWIGAGSSAGAPPSKESFSSHCQ